MDACPFVWTKNLILSERNTDTPAGQNRRGLGDYLFSRITRTGLPAAKAPGGISRLTRDPTPPLPRHRIRTPGRMVVLAPIITESPISTSPTRYSSIRYSWVRIVVL